MAADPTVPQCHTEVALLGAACACVLAIHVAPLVFFDAQCVCGTCQNACNACCANAVPQTVCPGCCPAARRPCCAVVPAARLSYVSCPIRRSTCRQVLNLQSCKNLLDDHRTGAAAMTNTSSRSETEHDAGLYREVVSAPALPPARRRSRRSTARLAPGRRAQTRCLPRRRNWRQFTIEADAFFEGQRYYLTPFVPLSQTRRPRPMPFCGDRS